MLCRFVGLLCIVLALGSLSFSSDAAVCPAKIEVRQQLAAPVSGWTPLSDDTPHQLAGITFYDGAPQERASLVYDDMKKVGGKQVASWNFAPGSGRLTWLACSYSGTDIQLTKALPASARSCQVTYDPQQQIAGLPSIEKITCK